MNPSSHADLLIRIAHQEGEFYEVELRFDLPAAAAEWAPQRGKVVFDVGCLQKLRASAQNPMEHGRLLSQALFASPGLWAYYEKCQSAADLGGYPLRLRLLVDRTAPQMNNLRWEMLRSSDDARFLATDANRPFSRFLYSADWSPYELRPRGELRALMLVANPRELEQGLALAGQKLAKVDVTAEVERARAALEQLREFEVLASREEEPGHASLANLLTHLRAGCDILYLVCHGVLLPDDPTDPDSPRKPYLLLEKEDGACERVGAWRLADALRDLPAEKRPRLAVLASCQSAGRGSVPQADLSSADQGMLAALGPLLVEAGIPAVLAMQDNIKMETVKQFMPAFFETLLTDGRVDQAMAAARSQVYTANRPDWWVPVLYLRLRGGRLWYQPGFAEPQKNFELWPGILAGVRTSQCLPVLGPGLLEFISGPPGRLARAWAAQYRYPLTVNSQEELPQVAQYVAAQIGASAARIELMKFIKARILEDFGSLLPPNGESLRLRELLPPLGEQRRLQNPSDPYKVLAELPFSIYVNTNADNLLESALRAESRRPQVLHFCWRSDMQSDPKNIAALRALQAPTPECPLVYHLFGHIQNPDSLVLTEDDFFDFMMWINKNDAPVPVPDCLQAAWNSYGLLLLGFQLTDWKFRLLFRSILSEDRRKARANAPFHSVSVQLQPGDDLLSPERARQYLEKYFPERFDIFWGNAEDFLKQLGGEWQKEGVV